MAQSVVSYRQGGENLKLFMKVQDQAGKVVDLTGCTVTLILEGSSKINVPGDLADTAADGDCVFTLNSTGDPAPLANKGTFQASTKVVSTTDTVLSDYFMFIVE